MSRYIDADAMVTAMLYDDEHEEYYTERMTIAEYLDRYTEEGCPLIDSAPSIDIVRCKECKHCKRKKGVFRGEPIFFYRCAEHNRDVESDDYCSWGEREGE